MCNKIIFISIDGMCDQLGQSQVLPYLVGLSKKGFRVSIISAEKKSNFFKNKNNIQAIVLEAKISWHYFFYESTVPVFSPYKNVRKLYALTKKHILQINEPVILHARSYLPALVAGLLKKKFNSFFLFDMRGFWADERLDGSIWKASSPIHKILYRYFKKKEKEWIQQADGIITLTQNAKNEIHGWNLSAPPIEVIPCCADTNHFSIKTDTEKRANRKKIGIPEDAYVLGYLGSLGTWYMLEEMLDFFIETQKIKPNSIFFFVSNDDKELILKKAKEKNIALSCFMIQAASRTEVPEFISCFDASIFFIKPLYSKKASSPTKMAEVLACGIPVITNTQVGDVDFILNKYKGGVLVSDFCTEAYKKALAALNTNQYQPEACRDIALQEFSLQKGIDLYQKTYKEITGKK
ncbi:MAG: glycosyltransferase [Bacteroidetes bacterium]|nr:glycosyltransferase [Bacteroidota bacterium]